MHKPLFILCQRHATLFLLCLKFYVPLVTTFLSVICIPVFSGCEEPSTVSGYEISTSFLVLRYFHCVLALRILHVPLFFSCEIPTTVNIYHWVRCIPTMFSGCEIPAGVFWLFETYQCFLFVNRDDFWV